MTDADFRTNTVFYLNPPSMNMSSIPLLTRGAILTQGIPALTPPTGRKSLQRVLNGGNSYDLNLPNPTDGEDETRLWILRPNGWPLGRDYEDRWLHSDIKDISFFYNFMFFQKVIEKGVLK